MRGALPLVAIVGRPNVGKSTLFNRLAQREAAIVEDVPGVTRDRHYADAEWNGRAFTLIDTGGFVMGEGEPLQKEIREQAQLAVEECEVTLLVVDGQTGPTPVDQEIAAYLRKHGKAVVLAVNKVDDPRVHAGMAGEFHRLGLGEPHEVSAAHSRGIEDLTDRLIALLPEAPLIKELEEGEEEPEDDRVRVAIVGRPNVGKSTLVNALLGKKRLITSDVAGTTRDPIDSELTYKDKQFILTDTAGIRRKATISHRVEQFAVVAALKAIDRSDVAVLVMDATEAMVDQDARIAGIAEEKGRGLVIVVNKWDLVKKTPGKEEAFRDELKYALKFVAYAPVIYTSALTGSKVEKVLELAADLAAQRYYRAPTPQLNRLLEHVTTEHPLPFYKSRALRIYYVAQVGTNPPAFAFVCNMPEAVPDRYKRYLLNQLRATFGLRVPLRLFFRERPGKEKRQQAVQRMKARAKYKKR
ncbi:MAG: ribosome biogenesis GTPase Der [Myxococcaceae bacterium]